MRTLAVSSRQLLGKPAVVLPRCQLFAAPCQCVALHVANFRFKFERVRYVKRNALAGRSEELTSWEDYGRLAGSWRDETANVRMHRTLNTRPIDRFEEERPRLRPLPAAAWDTDEIVPTVATSHALVRFDGNKYSVPVDVARRPVVLRAGSERYGFWTEVAQHWRSYGRNVTISQPEHELQARLQGQRQREPARKCGGRTRGQQRASSISVCSVSR